MNAEVIFINKKRDVAATTISSIIVSTMNGVKSVEIIETTTGDIVAHVVTKNVFTSYTRLKNIESQFAMRGIRIRDIEASPIAANYKHELSYAIYFTNINLL